MTKMADLRSKMTDVNIFDLESELSKICQMHFWLETAYGPLCPDTGRRLIYRPLSDRHDASFSTINSSRSVIFNLIQRPHSLKITPNKILTYLARLVVASLVVAFQVDAFLVLNRQFYLDSVFQQLI